MFCCKCGESIADGSEFCWKCGAGQQAAAGSGDSRYEPVKQGEHTGFLSTPAGKILVVMLILIVLAGAALVVVFLVSGEEEAYIDAEIMEVWDGFQEVVDFDSANFATIDLSLAGVTKAQADLKRIQQDVLEFEQDLAAFTPTSEESKDAYDILAAVLGYYDNYTDVTLEIYDIVATGQLLDTTILTELNAKFEEAQKFASRSETSAKDLLEYLESLDSP